MYNSHKEELHNIVRENKYERLRCAGHVARMEEGRSAFKILTDKSTERLRVLNDFQYM